MPTRFPPPGPLIEEWVSPFWFTVDGVVDCSHPYTFNLLPASVMHVQPTAFQSRLEVRDHAFWLVEDAATRARGYWTIHGLFAKAVRESDGVEISFEGSVAMTVGEKRYLEAPVGVSAIDAKGFAWSLGVPLRLDLYLVKPPVTPVRLLVGVHVLHPVLVS